MEDRASAIILRQRHLLLIHRIRTEQEFYVFPGGHIEEGESAEEACIREVLEETGLQTAWLSHAFDYAVAARMAHYFFVQVSPGLLNLGGPEVNKRSEKNRYLLEWLPLVQISQLNLRPEPVRDALAAIRARVGAIVDATDLAQYREQLQEILTG